MNAPIPAAAGVATIDFVGLDFTAMTMDAVLEWLARRGADDPFGFVVTPNVDHVVRLEHAPPPVRAAYRDAALCLCDSRILARLARLHGVRLPLVAGSDLVAQAFARVFRPGDRIALIGGTPGMAAALTALHPGLAIEQHVAPMGLLHDVAARAGCIDAAAAANARFVLLAVGSPQQEVLAAEMRASGRVRGTALCIGASVDFLVGAEARAPRIVQRAGLEWAWRLVGQPRRLWRRYLVDGPAIFPLVRRWARQRRAMRSGAV